MFEIPVYRREFVSDGFYSKEAITTGEALDNYKKLPKEAFITFISKFTPYEVDEYDVLSKMCKIKNKSEK